MPEISFKDQALSALGKGFTIMCLQTPFVNPLNRLSVVCSDTGYSALRAYRSILSGQIDCPEAPKRSFWHLQKGISGHLTKEIVRLFFKPFGAVFVKPEAEKTFPDSPLKASVAFAGTMASMEILVNPADAIRVKLQAGVPLHTLWPHPIQQLYAGSLGNVARQFGTWLVYNYSGIHLDRFFAEQTTLDTKSFDGMFLKSLIQASLITITVYPLFERLKNELQYNRSIQKTGLSLYKAAFDGVIRRSGPIGLTHGLLPKTLSNAILVYGFNWLVQNGKPKPTKQIPPLQIGSLVLENSVARISTATFFPEKQSVNHYNPGRAEGIKKRIIIPLQTGALDKLDGKGKHLGTRVFTRWMPVISPATDPKNLHANLNRGKDPLTVLIIELKN